MDGRESGGVVCVAILACVLLERVIEERETPCLMRDRCDRKWCIHVQHGATFSMSSYSIIYLIYTCIKTNKDEVTVIRTQWQWHTHTDRRPALSQNGSNKRLMLFVMQSSSCACRCVLERLTSRLFPLILDVCLWTCVKAAPATWADYSLFCGCFLRKNKYSY